MRGKLGYRLLTSGGPLAAIALLVLDIAVVRQSFRWWRGDGLWAVQQFGSSLIIGLPAFLALFALPGTVRGGAGVEGELLPLRPMRARLTRFVIDVLPVLAVHLAFVIFAIGFASTHGDQPEWASISGSISTQVVAIAAVCAMGRGISEVALHPIAIVIAGLVGVLLVSFGANALRTSAGSSPYAGLALNLRDYLIAGAVVFLAGLVVLARPSNRRWGGASLVASIAAILVTGQALSEPSVRPSGATPTDCTSANQVRVCVFTGYAFMSEDLVAKTGVTLDALAEAGIDPHLRQVVQSVPGSVETPGTVAVAFDPATLSAGRLLPNMVRGSLIHPSWCPRINSPDPLPAWFDAGQRNVYHWLEHQEGALSDKDYALTVPEFTQLSERQQKTFVQRFFDRGMSCRGLT